MPIGRFRTDPTDLDPTELEVHSAQIPEGSLVAGMGVGLVPPLVVLPEMTAVGAIVGGVVGYLVGHRIQDYRVRKRRG